jgi:hypothetical protein
MTSMPKRNVDGGYYKLRLKTQTFEVEVESSDREFVEEKIRTFADRVQRNGNEALSAGSISEPHDFAGTESGAKRLSLSEFIQRVGAMSGTEYVVAVGYFLEKHQGLKAFTSADVKAAFLKLKFQHSNPSDAIAKARAAGKLMEGQDKNTYVLTQTGEAWVAERLPAQ